MENRLLPALLALTLIVACNPKDKRMNSTDNPFFSEFGTPFEVPDFARIRPEHYIPAFREGMQRQKEEIDAITGNPEPPSFSNTIEAFDRTGDLLVTVNNVFDNMTSALTGDTIQAIAREVSPLISAHRDDILLNAALFQRIQAVFDGKEKLGLNTEQGMLLDKVYKQFKRGGAGLPEPKQAELREINKELSMLSLKFGENVLAETNAFKLIITDSADLAGLPAYVADAAAEAAAEAGLKGQWVFTLHQPSRIPFLTYSQNRELREKLFKAYIQRGSNGNSHDNRAILARMATLRVKKANLLGFPNHAAFVLDENMARTPEAVYDFLGRIWQAALPVAKKEAEELQAMIDAEKGGFSLEPWDWWYYSEKVRKEKYDLDEDALKPYFSLDNSLSGIFLVANKLYGLRFMERSDIPKYHPEVKTYEVLDSNLKHIGILLMDFFPRASKEGGAWMNSYRDQYRIGQDNISPVITMVCNFTKPTTNTPSLLSFEEVSTLFHEFGHALHGLLSDCTYRKLSGTSTPRDFVELPSQIMENWCEDPEVLPMFARHYQNHRQIPDKLIDKMTASRHFNQGFATVEYLSAAYLDMDWHTITDTLLRDSDAFESASLARLGLIPEIVVRYRSPYFSHIFSGGYSSGYYSYIWAEVLDADAYEAFKEKGVFDQATARAFRDNILSRGGTDDPMKLYVNFRGKEPTVDAMLRSKGLKEN